MIQTKIKDLLNNQLGENKISHAYLLIDNSHNEALEIAIQFSKAILCRYIKNQEHIKSIEKRIDENVYSDLTVIDGSSTIKKESIIALKKELMTRETESFYKVYIITNITNMNTSSSNSLLKVLEEPNSNIVAILIADDYNRVLNTIKSRCQILYLNNSKIENKVSESVLNFIKSYIDKNSEIIAYTKEYEEFLVDRTVFKKFVSSLASVYREAIIYNDNYMSDISKLIRKSKTFEQNKHIINVLVQAIEDSNYNVNVNMLFVNMILKMEVCK